ncbi:adenylyl-sulfate kinase [Aquabacterium sp.]|uniref:adenylyl-sulfate kinase n=1 Tax=Aquabacterium sp. TaxID=1872578 RepID=UPI003B6A3FDD
MKPQHPSLSHSGEQFEALIRWCSPEIGLAGRDYVIDRASPSARLCITRIKYKLDATSGAMLPCRELHAGDIALCNVALTTAMPTGMTLSLVDSESDVPRHTSANTLASVELKHVLRRAENLHTQALSVQRHHREWLHGHPGCVLWFTGLSGSGKSTLANALEQTLHEQGWHTYILDGDNIRQGLNKDLGFTDADRVENIRRIAEVAKLMVDAGLVVMTAFISPFRKERDMARDLIGADRFLEVYVNTPLEICEARDVKGLYKKARQGLIPNMTGINSPYEAPEQPGLVLSGAAETLDDAVESLMDWLSVKAGQLTPQEAPR